MPSIIINIAQQTLQLYNDTTIIKVWQVSTAANGVGEENGSYKTPRGKHIIRAKIGEGQAINTVFRARRPTGEIYSPQLAIESPRSDWILTRILWLSGCEKGKNRLGNVDTMRRYIYIHGTPDTTDMNTPGSIGCIRMRNNDLLQLFCQTPIHTPVNIIEA